MRITVKIMLLIFLSIMGCSTLVYGQEDSGQSLSEQIAQLSNQIEQDSQLVTDKKQQLNQQLASAQELIDEARQRRDTVDGYEDSVKQANHRLAALNAQTSQLAKQNIKPINSGSTEQRSNELAVMVAEQNALLTDLAALQDEQTALNSRSQVIGEQLVEARNTLDTLNQGVSDVKPQPQEFNELATYLEQQAKIFKLQSTIRDFEREVVTLPARKSLTAAKLGLVREQVRLGEKRIASVQDYLEQSRMGQATQAVAASQQALDSSQGNNALAAISQENLLLAKSLKELISQDPQKEDSTARLRGRIVDLQQSAETVERVLATGSLTDELGVLLRQLQARLPRLGPLEKRLEYIKESAIRQQLNLILWQERLRNLSAPEDAAVSLLKQHDSGRDFSQQDINSAKKLVEDRVELLRQLVDASIASTDRLTEEKMVITEAISRTEELTTLLDRRLIWLPSNAGLADNVWHNLRESAKWILNPSAWWQAASDLWSGLTKSILLTIVLLMLPVSIIAARPMVKRSLGQLIARVGKVGKDTYWATPLALAETLLLALPLPIFIATIAGGLSIGSQPGSFSSALGTALGAVSSLSLVLLFFRSMCRKNGIFVGHFGWSETAREKLRGILSWFVWLQCGATLVFALAMAGDAVELRYGVAGLAFIVGSVGISLFCLAFFKPKGGVASSIVGDTPATLLTIVSFPVVVASPLLIGLLPLFGFFDTAVALQSKLFLSGVVLIFTAILYGILMRVFLVAYRRFSLKRQKARRAEKELQRNKKQEADASGDAMPVNKPHVAADPDDVSKQTKSILMGLSAVIFLVCLWFIWKPLLPALGIVDDIVLWQRVQVVDGVEISSGVTLWNIIVALLLMFGGFVAAKNMRGILEVGFFERFKLDPGARYAAVTIMGYVLVGLGIVIGLGQLGIDWSKLQWIVAALGVGLGFGLQEIVANFVSGLIILFERPVRVGDTVTIGNLSGTVSNIKIRATTVTDFDNREVLLPNKSIITENVTNWTLNDAVTRIVLNIGVAYGSDIAQVRDLLMKVIESHADVLKLPAPNVFFINHGASSLDFEVRVFVSTPAKRLPVTHDINSMINQTLKEHHINIPFPQRDVHIISNQETTDKDGDE
ncbi:mechanosensitive ion channel domain-containing protein [Neptunicella sp.]|uniref:mechanosensitive ion channel domain-containing protein n=1 Tax=Neptunicella sp. TaxID=2125986 RepID=UPI003F693B43